MKTKSPTEVINDLADLQDQIYDISHLSTDEVLKSIKESYFVESKIYFTEILLTIEKSIESRPIFLHNEYYSLINLLKEEIQKYFSSYELCFNIFTKNEIRLKLLSFKLIDAKDIVFFIKLHTQSSKRNSLIKFFSEYIQPNIQELLSLDKDESDENNDNIDMNYNNDKENRIPFLSNRVTDDGDQNKSAIIYLLDRKAPLTEKEKDSLIEAIQKSIAIDDIDNFQFLVSSTNTFINQVIWNIDLHSNTLSNTPNRVTLIDYAALNGSIKIFKFLIMNKNIIVNNETVINAIKGGNYDIIHIIESTDKTLFSNSYDTNSYIKCAISCNQNQILDYLIENYNYDLYDPPNIQEYCIKAIENYNYDIFSRLVTYFSRKEENYQSEINIVFLNRMIRGHEDGEAENLLKRSIYNGATQMFILMFQNLYNEIKEALRHKCMKAAFQSESKSILEFLLKENQIQNKENQENIFELNFSFYRDDINFMDSAAKNNLNFIIYIFNLVDENIQNYELKCSFYSKTNSSDQNILHDAAKNDWLEILDFFIEKNLSITDCAIKNDYQINTPLHIAAESHSTSFIKSIILNKEKIYRESNFVEYFNSSNYDGFTPFLLAVSRGFLDTVEFLISVEEINFNARDNMNQNALQIAVKNNRNKVFKFLISNIKLVTSLPKNENFSRSIDFSNIDANGQNLLHIAAYEARVEMVKKIIELKDVFKPSLLNEKDNEDHTPLHFAAYSGNAEIVDILLNFIDSDEKLDVNPKGIENETPLHWAAENGFIDVVRLLCEKGHADVNAIDNDGNTPLQRAEMRNHTEIVDYLSQFAK